MAFEHNGQKYQVAELNDIMLAEHPRGILLIPVSHSRELTPSVCLLNFTEQACKQLGVPYEVMNSEDLLSIFNSLHGSKMKKMLLNGLRDSFDTAVQFESCLCCPTIQNVSVLGLLGDVFGRDAYLAVPDCRAHPTISLENYQIRGHDKIDLTSRLATVSGLKTMKVE